MKTQPSTHAAWEVECHNVPAELARSFGGVRFVVVRVDGTHVHLWPRVGRQKPKVVLVEAFAQGERGRVAPSMPAPMHTLPPQMRAAAPASTRD